MKNILTLLLIIIISTSFFADQKENKKKNPAITSKEIIGHISFLASDEMKGRLTGTKEMSMAAEYIKEDFEQSGLKPFFNNSFLQEFPFINDVKLTKNNSISFSGSFDKSLKLEEDFITYSLSGNIDTTTSLAFVGYGLIISKLNFDEYEGIDVNGKIVIVLRGDPEGENPHSDYAMYSSLPAKARNARDKGAKGIIFVNGYKDEDGKKDVYPKFDSNIPSSTKIGLVQIKKPVIEKFIPTLKELQEKIDSTKKPQSYEVKDLQVKIQTELEPVYSKGLNVAGVIKGSDKKLSDEYIVLGAHFDHLGMGIERSSLYTGKEKKVHNGADDNASGTSAILELAEKLASSQKELKRSIIVASFSGEELGLLGSDYMAKNLPIPKEKIVAMLNFDMVGRLNNDRSLMLSGTGTSSIWKDKLNKLNDKYKFKLSFNDDGFGGSDHTSFYIQQIPVLFYFTGIHSDYHKPDDDTEKINVQGEEDVVNYAYDLVVDLANSEKKPDYVNVPRKQPSTKEGARVYVGTIPDYSTTVDGYKINGVTPGSPADKAGIKPNDIMVKFGKFTVSNLQDYSDAMKEFKPGDKVEVVLKRGNEVLTVNVELGSR